MERRFITSLSIGLGVSLLILGALWVHQELWKSHGERACVTVAVLSGLYAFGWSIVFPRKRSE